MSKPSEMRKAAQRYTDRAWIPTEPKEHYVKALIRAAYLAGWKANTRAAAQKEGKNG